MQLTTIGTLVLFSTLTVACAEGAATEDTLPNKSSNKKSNKDAGSSKIDAASPVRDAEPIDSAPPPPQNNDALCINGLPDQCNGCCSDNHASGYFTYVESLLGCLCQPSVCASSCATTLCNANPQGPDSVCDACFSNRGQTDCAAPVQAACAADQDCVSMVTCWNSCPF